MYTKLETITFLPIRLLWNALYLYVIQFIFKNQCDSKIQCQDRGT